MGEGLTLLLGVTLNEEGEELGGVEARVDDTVARRQGKLDQGDAGWGAAIHPPHEHLTPTAMTSTLTGTWACVSSSSYDICCIELLWLGVLP